MAEMDASAYFMRGIEHAKKGEDDQAIAAFTEAIKANPNYARAYYQRGYMYLLKKDEVKCILDSSDAIRIGLSDTTCEAWTYYNLGCSYSNKDSYKALAYFEKAISLMPNDEDIRKAFEKTKTYFSRISETEQKIKDASLDREIEEAKRQR